VTGLTGADLEEVEDELGMRGKPSRWRFMVSLKNTGEILNKHPIPQQNNL
jgi:hypothetical protein